MASKNKNYFIVNIPGGEEVLVDWANNLCQDSAKAIQKRMTGFSSKFSTLSEYGDPEGFVDVSEGEIERTRGEKARAPYGHRRAYYIRAGAYGLSNGEIARLLKKAKDAGRI